MNNDWLAKYPRAAAMLQGDDDVLDYAPQSCQGLEAPDALDPYGAAALPDDVPPGALAAAVQAIARRVDAEMLAAYRPRGAELDVPLGTGCRAWLEPDGIGVNLAGNGQWQAFYQDREADLPAGEAYPCYGINDQPTPEQAVETLRAILASQGVVPRAQEPPLALDLDVEEIDRGDW